MNKLERFLKEKRLTDTAFAVLVGVSQSTVSRWRVRRVTPTPDAMRKIAHVTNGSVTPNDFIQYSDDPTEKHVPANTEHAQ